jgi:CRISPR-associated protein Csh1
MGFLNAVYGLGMLMQQRNKESDLADVINFLQLPHPLGEVEERRARVIRIWLKVADPDAQTLDIQGIGTIDLRDYPGFDNEDRIKEHYLYRKPVGSAAQWSFSPIYKLGKGEKDGRDLLLGDGCTIDKNSRFYKLRKVVLQHFEDMGCFTSGSVERIMAELVDRVDEIADRWKEKKRSYLLIFGVDRRETFLYPGQIPAFIAYFKNKLALTSDGGRDKPATPLVYQCALCGDLSSKVNTMDKVFKFATFDKDSFLPGARDGVGVKEKTGPVCSTCYALLSAGKTEMENKFINLKTLPGINLYIVPEIYSDNSRRLRNVSEKTKRFLANGVKFETEVFEYLAEQGDGLIYHFLFTELNNAQVKVHFLIEDVPPTRLNHLWRLWEQTCKTYRGSDAVEERKVSLDQAFRQVVAIILALAGKSEQDKKAMRDKALQIIGALLNNESVDVLGLKNNMVLRFPGLFTNPDWLRPKAKEELPGRLKVRGMAEVIDFLIRVNRRRGE